MPIDSFTNEKTKYKNKNRKCGRSRLEWREAYSIWYKCVWVCVCGCVYMSLSLSLFIRVCICVCVCAYIYTYIHVCIYIHIHIYTRTCIYTYVYTCIHTHIQDLWNKMRGESAGSDTSLYGSRCVCVCVCVCVCFRRQWHKSLWLWVSKRLGFRLEGLGG